MIQIYFKMLYYLLRFFKRYIKQNNMIFIEIIFRTRSLSYCNKTKLQYKTIKHLKSYR